MSRINTNIASMNAIGKLVANNNDLTTRLQRLSSGLRINAGKDDPAGLIASENLRSEMAGLRGGIANSIRASSVISTAEGALNEVSALLIDIKELLVTTASKGGLSTEEIDANQMQVDSAINSIERIANSTEFEGKKLLNGNLDYNTDPLTAGEVEDVQINSAKLIDGAAMAVAINQTVAADQGSVTFTWAAANTTTQAQVTIQVSSNRGTTELTFAAGTDLATIATAVNAVSEITGVTAVAGVLTAVDYGSNAYAKVEIISDPAGASELEIGGAAGTGESEVDYGVDAVAVVNGTSAIGDGRELTVRTGMLDAKITMDAALGVGTSTVTITSGGADFAIGSRVDAIGMEAIGIMNTAPSQLGNITDGYLNTLKSGMTNALSSDNLYTAQKIVDDAIKDVSTLRGRLGAFQKNILETNVNSLSVALENVTASESMVRDADFATETAALTRAQILVQANTSILSLANAMPQSVLALLG